VPQLRSPRIWGTFSAAGGVGATTLTFHLARLAAANGVRTLVVESAAFAPLREILESAPPFWEDYRVGTAISDDALPRSTRAGFSLLTRRHHSPLTPELFSFVMGQVAESFDLILIDNPPEKVDGLAPLFIAENSLPSLIGLHTLISIHKPHIFIVNKFSSRARKLSAIEGFIVDARTFRIPKSPDLALAIGFGINQKIAKRNEKTLAAILAELLR
jgi:cellulose biosynthesis protein BcsQ